MKSLNLLKWTILFFGLLLAGACSSGGSGVSNDAGELTDQADIYEPPKEYASLKNPLEGQSEAIKEGGVLFQANCSSCHGPAGEGDGPAAAGLNPKPKNLAENQANLEDGYLYWRIAEGGLMEPFNSVMPAWKGLLDQEETWQVISFIRTLN